MRQRTIPLQPIPVDDAAEQVLSLYERQKRIYPRSVHGWFATWRWILVAATQLLYYGLPWLQWNGRQLVLFDLGERRFYVFALVLYPQDFVYLTALLIISAYGLFFFTAVAGRQWCGYACPQTVYTEIFMAVERRIEGDRSARIRLDAAPWRFDKLWRKGAKQAVWIAIAFWTGFTFVGYFTPIRPLWADLLALQMSGTEAFWTAFYGFATYGNAGYLREQVCKYMCPYARFQGVMFDRDTLVVAYDPKRGEPRGARPKHAGRGADGLGDCINCTLCVQVCPTGIDIREGLQYECISCSACIDACDGVMDKMAYPRGLIRYSTQDGIEHGLSRAQMWRRVLRPRVVIYGVILLVISAAFVVSLALRSTFKVDVIRDRGALARLAEDGGIENSYRLQIMNASEQAGRYELRAEGLPGLAVVDAAPVEVGAAQARLVPLRLVLPAEAAQALPGRSHRITIHVRQLPAAGSRREAVDVSETSTFVIAR